MDNSELPQHRAAPTWWAEPYRRPILNEVLLRMPHSVLYHYTTQAGLLGILKNREIWATHTQYLNDRREFRHALGLFREELDSLISQVGATARSNALGEMRDVVQDEISDINVCVASFSEDSDSLSQWRAYGGASGFAMGFQGEHLAALTAADNAYLAPCIYDHDMQRRVVRARLDEVLDQNLAEVRVNPRPGGNLHAYLLRFAPLLKHNSFASEREWRIITRPLMCTLPGFEFRPGVSTITPYYRFPLERDESPFSVAETVVGPTPHERQARASVKSIFVRMGLETTVRCSEVPYRNW